jgi:hypothetical protein
VLVKLTLPILGGRRGAASMSATETVRLVRYRGARARWAARSAAGWPWRAHPDDRQAHTDQGGLDQNIYGARL